MSYYTTTRNNCIPPAQVVVRQVTRPFHLRLKGVACETRQRLQLVALKKCNFGRGHQARKWVDRARELKCPRFRSSVLVDRLGRGIQCYCGVQQY